MADKVQGATKGTQDKIQGATTGILGSIEGWGNWITAKGKAMLDRVFPPEMRAAFLAKLQAFMLANPKLSVSIHDDTLNQRLPLTFPHRHSLA